VVGRRRKKNHKEAEFSKGVLDHAQKTMVAENNMVAAKIMSNTSDDDEDNDDYDEEKRRKDELISRLKMDLEHTNRKLQLLEESISNRPVVDQVVPEEEEVKVMRRKLAEAEKKAGQLEYTNRVLVSELTRVKEAERQTRVVSM